MALHKVKKLASGFGVRVSTVKKISNGVFRLHLQGSQSYALKRMPVSILTLKWMDRSLQGIRRNGFARLSWRNEQKEAGKRLYVRLKREHHPNVLNPWIVGRWPSVHSMADMKRCGVALAQFHRASYPYRHKRAGANYQATNWEKTLRANHLLLSKMIQKSSSRASMHAIDRILKQHGAVIKGYSNEALHLLKRYNYRTLCVANRHLITLCHGDVGPTNYIFNKEGVHLIDFEALQINFRAYDLYRVIYNSCQHNGWAYATAQAIIEGYQSVTQLEKADFALLHVLLRFPRMTYLLLRHYNNAGSRVRAEIGKALPHAIAMEKKASALINRLMKGESI